MYKTCFKEGIRRVKYADFFDSFEEAKKSIDEYSDEYLKNSTIHGLKYSYGKGHRKLRYFWYLLNLIGLGMACWLTSLLWNLYSSKPIASTLRESHFPASESPFLAVTVCDRGLGQLQVDNFLKNLKYPKDLNPPQIEEALPEIQRSFDDFSKIETLEKKQKNLQTILEYNYMTPRDAMKLLSKPCSDILLTCRWEGESVPCDKLFQPSLCGFGYCCTFDLSQIRSRHNKSARGSTWYFGPDFGLSLLLHHTPDLITVIHKPHQLPWSQDGDGYTVVIPQPAETTFVEVNSKLIWHSTEVLSLPVKSRKCKQNKDMVLNYFSEYSSASCVVECRVNASLGLCGCAPYNTPVENVMVCGIIDLLCLNDHFGIIYAPSLTNDEIEDDEELNDHGDEEKDAVKPCSCWRNCKSVEFHVHAENIVIDAFETGTHEILKSVKNLNKEAIVHIYNAKQTVQVWEKRLMFSWFHLLGNVGGVTSLCLGCSIVSIVEVLYFCFVKACFKYSTKSLVPLLVDPMRGSSELRNDTTEIADVTDRVKETIAGPSVFGGRKENHGLVAKRILTFNPNKA